jgi:hypothetical protein
MSNSRIAAPRSGVGYAWVFILSLLLCALTFREVLLRPNSTMIQWGGDGSKNYAAYLWHAQYGHSFVHSEYMNYPFGELLVFNDAQPLLTDVVVMLRNWGVPVQGYLMGIFNLFIVLNFLTAPLIMYALYRRLAVPMGLAVIGAVVFPLISPQLYRLSGHFALAYLTFLPLLFYFLLRWTEKPQMKWALSIIGIITLFAGFHMYYLPMGLLLVGTYLGFWVLGRGFKVIRKECILIALALITPLVISILWTRLPDSITDRPDSPWGFWFAVLQPWSLFLQQDGFLQQFIFNYFSKFHYNSDFEQICYTGLVASLGLLLSPVLIFYRKRFDLPREQKLFFYLLVPVVVVSLLVSTAVVFEAIGRDRIDQITTLKQFRALARLAWPAAFAINILAIGVLATIWKQANWVFRMGLFLLVVFLSVFDIYETHSKRLNLDMGEHPSFTYGEYPTDLLWLKNLDSSRYSAVTSLPFFHVGSDVFTFDPGGDAYRIPAAVALKTGMRQYGHHGSRTSLSQTIAAIGPVVYSVDRPEFSKQHPDRRPLLAISFHGGKSWWETGLSAYGKVLFREKEYDVLELPWSVVDSLHNEIVREAMSKYTKVRANQSAEKSDSIRTSVPAKFVAVNLESTSDAFTFKPYLGKSSMASDFRNGFVLYRGALPESGKHRVSFWLRVAQGCFQTKLLVRKLDGQDRPGEVLFDNGTGHLWNGIQGEWVQVCVEIPETKLGDKVQIELLPNEPRPGFFSADALLIWPSRADVFQPIPNGVRINNIPYIKW